MPQIQNLVDQSRATLKLGQNLEIRLGLENCPIVKSAKDVVRVFQDINFLEKSVLCAGCVDGHSRLLRWDVIALSSDGRFYLRPGDCFSGAISSQAAGIFLIHNHPDFALFPKPNDYQLTQSIVEAGGVLGIPVFDHVVVAENGFYSLLADEEKIRDAQKKKNTAKSHKLYVQPPAKPIAAEFTFAEKEVQVGTTNLADFKFGFSPNPEGN